MKTRRFFAGNTLPQALMAAARFHALSPDELAYRLRDKHHGFVNRVRRFIVEVDPAAPQRPSREGHPAPPAPAKLAPNPSPSRVESAAAAPLAAAPTAPATAVPTAPKARSAEPRTAPSRTPAPGNPNPRGLHGSEGAAPRAHGPSQVEPFLPPDEESELAASVAMGKLLALARLELTVRVERQPERLLIALAGQDEERLRDLGEEFLDDLEHLVPRAIRGLAGRMVRCKVEGAGLRSAREVELRELAERAAAEVAASGEAVLLDPLSSADRRMVHLALVDDPRVTTESQGLGAEKRVRIAPAAAGTPRIG